MEGSTFTLANIGNIGVTAGMPLIFRPQIAIGAIGAIHQKTKFVKSADGKYVGSPTEVFTLCMTVDHRIVDGATGARFNQRVKQFLEEPEIMALLMK